MEVGIDMDVFFLILRWIQRQVGVFWVLGSLNYHQRSSSHGALFLVKSLKRFICPSTSSPL